MTDEDEQMQDYFREVTEVIRKHGWLIQGVFPTTRGSLGFAYTVGLAAAGLPELIMSGAYGSQAQDLLNVAARVHLGQMLKAGQERDDIANVTMRIIAAPQAQISVAKTLYGPNVTAVQLCWPDIDGSWPPGEFQELFGPAWWL